MAQPGARHLDGFGQRLNGFILTKDQHFQAVAEVFQRIAIARETLFSGSAQCAPPRTRYPPR
jgi:hypothetical protein